ncbi:hypothetical protein H257_18683 [Aphanomyces astaci]|uniref:AMP-binding enzyme C-terminal domain-containing protein n=1 Tax=Aphanomyces astaci TaxID=112090 RepID=W4FBY9_APHAT|nr:hypothetical protein H257_18683 [Aphanomyces astaci]ETV64434.1 hypothetical protein H257_18683 [Aphanomyces astaci]|eukprot:XP_009846087.1 hypothetical protein H257_18683 [Aphanomyces astaci]
MVRECAVYGVPDETWGQVVTAAVVYKWPRVVHVVPAIPKNAMGKVNKKQLTAVFDTEFKV